jgi:hypothetical protein
MNKAQRVVLITGGSSGIGVTPLKLDVADTHQCRTAVEEIPSKEIQAKWRL